MDDESISFGEKLKVDFVIAETIICKIFINIDQLHHQEWFQRYWYFDSIAEVFQWKNMCCIDQLQSCELKRENRCQNQKNPE